MGVNGGGTICVGKIFNSNFYHKSITMNHVHQFIINEKHKKKLIFTGLNNMDIIILDVA